MYKEKNNKKYCRLMEGFSLPNFRDVGGIVNKEGRSLKTKYLLRSSAIIDKSDFCLDKIHCYIGPAIYVDLRTDKEIIRDGEPVGLIERGWQWCRFPIENVQKEIAGEMERPFSRMISRYMSAIEFVIKLMGKKPVIIACSLGKDRTGFVVALLHHYLKVSHSVIVHEFILSNKYLSLGRHLLPARYRDVSCEINKVKAKSCYSALNIADSFSRKIPSKLLSDLDSGFFDS